jgi:hypothetical protein
VSAFQSASALSWRGQRGWEGSKERRLALPANSLTLWALWDVCWVFWDAVDMPGVVVDDAGGVEDAAGISEALLAFLGRLACPE